MVFTTTASAPAASFASVFTMLVVLLFLLLSQNRDHYEFLTIMSAPSGVHKLRHNQVLEDEVDTVTYNTTNNN